VLDHLDDIASDFSAIHQVRDVTVLDGASFLRLAWRLPCYRGAMREAVLRQQQEREEPSPASRAAPQYASARPDPQRRHVPATKAALMTDPAFKGIFSFG
jgi:hypothetical protein